MTTLIAMYNSDGCCGRCDEKCYNATGLECDCICNGINHGVGKEKAVQQTQAVGQEIIDDFNEKNFDKVARMGKELKQEQLFDANTGKL